MSPLFAEDATVFFSQEQVEHTKRRRKGGEDVAVFFRGSCQPGSCSSRGGLHFPRWKEDTRVPMEGLVVLKGDLTTVSTEVRLEGEKEGL